MNRSRRAFTLPLVLVLVPAAVSTRQPPREAPRQPVGTLEARVSLDDRDLAYGGVDERDPGSRAREGRGLRDGEVFGWHDGSIRLVGMIDTAGGCASPRGISASLDGKTVRVEIEQATVCPAVYTPHAIYARVSGLRPGRYELKVLAARGLSLPLPPGGVEVPGLSAPRF